MDKGEIPVEKTTSQEELIPVISEYKDRVLKLNIRELQDIRILGSFGKRNNKKTSDLDPWLVLHNLVDLEELSFMSRKEIEIRKTLASEFDFPNLARHRATILSAEQTHLYEKAFAIRVGIPHNKGATLSLITGERNPEVIFHPTDLIATLDEYQGHYDRIAIRGDRPDLLRKFAQRTIQDTTLYFENKYITDKEELDEIIKNKFEGKDELVMEESRKTVELLAKTVSEDQIKARTMSHNLLLTMEKSI